MADYALKRRMMVDNQLRTFDVTDQSVLGAMDTVPRENFVPESDRELSYTDRTVSLSFDGVSEHRDLLTPMVLARMLQAAEIEPGDLVLDIGGGTGYTAAVIAELGAKVVALESDFELAQLAKANLAGSDVTVVTGPLSHGSAGQGPYDVIFVNGCFEVEPINLLAQLKDGGRLVGVAGTDRATRIVRYRRTGDDVGVATIINAFAPKLAAFARTPSFVF